MTTTKHFDDASSLEAINAKRLRSDLKVLGDVLRSAQPIASRLQVLKAVENSKISFEIEPIQIAPTPEDGTYVAPEFGFRLIGTHKKGLLSMNEKFGLLIILNLDGEYSVKSLPGYDSFVQPVTTKSATEVGQYMDHWVKMISDKTDVDLNPILKRTREELERTSAASRSAPTPGK